MPSIDLKLGARPLPPEGFYRIEVQPEPSISQNKDKDGFNIVMEMMIVDPIDEEQEGYKFPVWLSLKGGALPISAEILGHIMQTEGEITLDDEWVDENLPGRSVIGLLIHNEYQGRLNVNVKAWRPDNPVTHAAIDPEDRKFT
jgi:hypothetical protein